MKARGKECMSEGRVEGKGEWKKRKNAGIKKQGQRGRNRNRILVKESRNEWRKEVKETN